MMDFTLDQITIATTASVGLVTLWLVIADLRIRKFKKQARREIAKLMQDFLGRADKADEVLKDYVEDPKKFSKTAY